MEKMTTMDKYIDKLTKEDCKEIFDNLWLRTTEFMKITGMTEGQYRNCYRQWKKENQK